ncbi:MAG: 3-methyl-2-oxobutanoate dehydrogenase subunit VorB [Synergistaceae bacterium]|jgi:2-oxoglutarate ferredoxin oxidoreductase subunit alpha|nr:3-methyl-2-oxobutanoate dehydrogenase subunit VorB [Synergistaceae bacterium]
MPDISAERVLMKGNEALAEGAIRAGCRHYFGYPITPQTEIAAYLSRRMPQIGGTFLQAESEIAAINMVLGASAAGVRAMTSSSSPGISLKSEGISYLAGSDLPCVIVNIQRGGPGLGGIQPSQADYFLATKSPGHGDLHILVFAPSTVQEMAALISDAFDKSEEYRIPAMILGDGLLGQMMEPVVLPPEGSGSKTAKNWATCGHGNKRPHNIINSLYLQPEILEKIVIERFKRYEDVKSRETRAESYLTDDADLLVVAYGATARIAKSAIDFARERGAKVGLLRPITLWPFPENELRKAAKGAANILTVEMSMGQMVDDVKLAVECRIPVHFFGRTGGMIPTPDEIVNEIEKISGTTGGDKK